MVALGRRKEWWWEVVTDLIKVTEDGEAVNGLGQGSAAWGSREVCVACTGGVWVTWIRGGDAKDDGVYADFEWSCD